VATSRNLLVRVARAWRGLAPDQRLAALAALGLLVSMFLPWYEKSVVIGRSLESDSLTAFGVLSFVEAAIFLVTCGVLVLLFFRAERRAFHLPGGDGTVVFAAGAWAAFLLFVRVFSRPEVHGNGSTIGIQWGFFIAFMAAGALAYAGWRMRSAARLEPTAAQDPTTRVEPAPLPATRRAGPAPRGRPSRRVAGPDDPTRIAGQLSFEEDEPLRPGEIPPARRDR
jgi:hypothetical protein